MSVDVSPDPLDPANPPDLDWLAKDPDLSALVEEPDLAPFAEARTVGDAFRDAFSPEARETWEQVALSGLGNPPQERLNPDD